MRFIPLTSLPGEERYPAFSPDGKQIAFSWTGDMGENYDIYIKLIGTGTPHRLTSHPGFDFCPAWSPDGRHIAFARFFQDEYTIHIIPALGGAERKLQSVKWHNYWFHNISWSPDGKFLAIPERESSREPLSLYLLSLESFDKYKLTTPPALSHGDKYSAFSPDGKKLAFIRDISWGTWEIYVVPVTGGESQQLTFDNEIIYGLTWTPDGRDIVFCSTRMGGGEGLWRISVTGGRPEPLPLVAGGEHSNYPTISPRGQQLAYEQWIRYEEDIWRIEIPQAKGQSSVPHKLMSSSRIERNPQLSPDGSRIAFESNRTGSHEEIWMCDSNGQNAVQLTFLDTDTGTPRWSPDGRHIAFDSRQEGHSDIFVLNVDGGNPQRITREASDDITPNWSRDGRWIYFASNRSEGFQIWKIPMLGGDAVQITNAGGGIAPVESFDGKWVYYPKRDKSGLWKISVGGGEESFVLEFPIVQDWNSWFLGEDGIYYINKRITAGSAIEFFSFATGNVTKIAELGSKNTRSLGVSPDRRWLLYSQWDTESDIRLVENFR